MSYKINVKLVLELHAAGMSQNAIAKTRHISKRSVSDVLRIAYDKQLTYEMLKNESEEAVYRLFYPDKFAAETMYHLPDYACVHNELKRIGVTLKLLWMEYREACAKDNGIAIGYTKFCTDYEKYTLSHNLTNHLEHKPGNICEVDWSGPTMKIIDPVTGETGTIYLFVATLPYSQYAYVEACLDQKEDTWLRCHANMYEFLGGVPRRTVCDNLKTGVIRHPKEGEIVLNNAYEALGSHYATAIMPTGIRKPKQKASVEGTVGKIATAIIAQLRNSTFFSLPQLQQAVRKQLDAFNKAPFQKRSFSRYEVFLDEQQYLHELPEFSYEIATWIYDRKVYPNSHISVEKNFYSCPYAYVGSKVDVKLTDKTLEIYFNHQRISTHLRFPAFLTNRYDTHPEDMPEAFNQPEMNDVRMCKWADKMGSSTRIVVDRIFESVHIKEQAYNSVLSVLKLSNVYSEEQLEDACDLALRKIHSPRYRHLKSILANPALSQETPVRKPPKATGYVRGSEYYGGGHHVK